jgi:xanthine dehydrogenase small subunit
MPPGRWARRPTTLFAGASRGERFPHLISVEALPELRAFGEGKSEVELGAALTLSEIEALWPAAPAVLREWLALDARVRIASTAGGRMAPLAEFFRGYRKTALATGELLVSIHLPRPFPRQIRFFKVAKRRMDDISTVAAAFAVDLDNAGRVTRARLAYGGVAEVRLRATEAEDALTGRAWDEASLNRAQEILERTLKPISDHRGSAAYRLAMAQSLLEKFHYEQHAGAGA